MFLEDCVVEDGDVLDTLLAKLTEHQHLGQRKLSFEIERSHYRLEARILVVGKSAKAQLTYKVDPPESPLRSFKKTERAAHLPRQYSAMGRASHRRVSFSRIVGLKNFRQSPSSRVSKRTLKAREG